MHHPSARPALAALALGLVLALSSTAAAQVIRPSESLYAQLRAGGSVYVGDLTDDGFGGIGIGGEVGYLFDRFLSAGVGFYYHDLPIRDGVLIDDGEVVAAEQGGTAYQLQGLLRYSPLAGRVSPFVEAGGALVFGQGNEAGRNNGSAEDDVLGYGPVGGLGVDIALTPQIGFQIGAQATAVFPDVALDNTDAGSFGIADDDTDYDVLGLVYGGLRYAFRSPYTPVELTRLDCPAEVTQGESATFSAFTNAEATPPVSIAWDWGDGSTGAGMTASHTYRSVGSYTVTATALSDFNDDMSTCQVTVVEPQIPPALSACTVSPQAVSPGETVTLSGRVGADATQPVSVAVSWGDGDGDSGTDLPSTHSYSEPGTYTVSATASNAYGSDTCTATVTVEDAFCANVSEFNSVYFDFGSAALTPDARDLLGDNILALRQCQDVCVLVRGYTDDRETDQIRLSQRRADAIRDAYIDSGVSLDRIRAEGLGQDPSANSKEDPGPGDNRARRGDSIPAACGTFTPRGFSRR